MSALAEALVAAQRRALTARKPGPKPQMVALRVLARVKVRRRTGCWEWQGYCEPSGYGKIGIGKAAKYAHRVAYEQFVEPIPPGLQIDHLCRNRKCVNPEHLEAVTPRENTLRGESVCAAHARKTHCKHGHAFSVENTAYDKSGRHRRCKACTRAKEARRRARRTAEA